jgi:tetratricopeptide (TPR) repeat protein
MRRPLAAAALVCLGLLAPAAHAQTGAVRGKVMDAAGKPLADVKVAIDFRGGVARTFEVKTNKKGEFLQVGLQPGNYRITASREGYQQSYIDLHISVGDPTEVPEFKLNTLAEAAKQGGGAEAEALQGSFKNAVELQSAGKLDEAEAAYKAILEKSPNVVEVYQNLGSIYLAKKDYPAAEAALQKGLELKPGSPELSTLLARVYQGSGQSDKAMALMEKSAGDNPTDAKAQFNRGIFLLNANKNEEAIAAFEAAIKADANMAEAYYRLGALMVGQGKIPEAIQNLEKYLSLNPTDTQNVAVAQGLLKALKK